MRKLKDLIIDLRKEIKDIPTTNKKLLTWIGRDVKAEIQNMIGTKQAFWQDLKPDTIERKRRSGGGKNGDPSSILYDTGEFERSIDYRVVNAHKVTIFSTDPTALYHELGTQKQPPRPVFKPATILALKKFKQQNEVTKFYLTRLR